MFHALGFVDGIVGFVLVDAPVVGVVAVVLALLLDTMASPVRLSCSDASGRLVVACASSVPVDRELCAPLGLG